MISSVISSVLLLIPQTPDGGQLSAAMQETYNQGLCIEWVDTALEAGWDETELPKLFRIMERESRCKPEACSVPDRPDLRRCRDWGLMQINDYSWKRVIREQGYNIEDMADPYHNLVFAKWLHDYSMEVNGDGWQPWKKK